MGEWTGSGEDWRDGGMEHLAGRGRTHRPDQPQPDSEPFKRLPMSGRDADCRVDQFGVGTQNGPRYTLRFCRAFDGAHLAKRSERGGWRIGIGPEVIAGEIDMLPTER